MTDTSTASTFSLSSWKEYMLQGATWSFKSLRDRLRRPDGRTDVVYGALLFVAFLTTSAGMTGIITYANVNAGLAVPMATLIAAVLFMAMDWAVHYARSFTSLPARLAAIGLYLLSALISVFFAFAFWWTAILSQEHTQYVAQTQTQWVMQVANSTDSNLTSMVTIATQMETYSANAAKQEQEVGKTCDAAGGNAGPRTRLRNDDAVAFRESSAYVRGLAQPTQVAINGLKDDMKVLQTPAFLKGSPARRAAIIDTVNTRIAAVGEQVQRVSADPNLGPQMEAFKSRLSMTRGTITRDGQTFTCEDATLRSNLQGMIGAIQALQALPSLSAMRIEMAEGGEADWFALQRALNTVAAFFERSQHRPTPQQARQLVVQGAPAVQPAPIPAGAGVIAGKDWAAMFVALFIDVAIGVIGFTKPRLVNGPAGESGQYGYIIQLLRSLIDKGGLFASLAPYHISMGGHDYLVVPSYSWGEPRPDRRSARLVGNAAAVLVGLKVASEYALWGPWRRRALKLLDANRKVAAVDGALEEAEGSDKGDLRARLGALLDMLSDKKNANRAHHYRFLRLKRGIVDQLSFQEIANPRSRD